MKSEIHSPGKSYHYKYIVTSDKITDIGSKGGHVPYFCTLLLMFLFLYLLSGSLLHTLPQNLGFLNHPKSIVGSMRNISYFTSWTLELEVIDTLDAIFKPLVGQRNAIHILVKLVQGDMLKLVKMTQKNRNPS